MMQNQNVSNTVPMGQIQSKFPALRWNKAAKENKAIPLREIADATGLSLGTIHKLSTGKVEGVKLETIARLCDYFGVGVGDILEYKED